MILHFGRGDLVRGMQEDMADLKQQLAALATQVAALSAQLSVEAERTASAEAELEQLRGRLDGAVHAAAEQDAAVGAQRHDVERLAERMDKQDEAMAQGRAAIARVEKQAAVDLDEIRRLNTATTATLLRRRAELSSN
ncbi:hypothetical protein ACFSGX_13160 [Sphingomonas arantia]|uniref:Uncharacterized protein n=1 Tax=Sphingomonas arantia TaxID=1460676 RepID=A0ABW4TYY5_9SPHN